MLTEVNVPDGGSDCAVVLPQQVMVSSVRIPHDSRSPTLTDVNVPVGGIGGRSPQQVMVPSVLTPHAANPSVLTDVKVSLGTVSSTSVAPQQTTVPSVFTPHAAASPTATERNVPDGMSDRHWVRSLPSKQRCRPCSRRMRQKPSC